MYQKETIEDVYRKGTVWVVLFADCPMHCLLNLIILHHKSMLQFASGSKPKHSPTLAYDQEWVQ